MKYDLTLPHDREKYLSHSIRLLKKSAKVDLTEKFPARTIKQNSYFHVLLAYIAIEMGETVERVKRQIKRQRLDMFEFVEDGYKHLRSSADLSTKEMVDICGWIRRFAAMEMGTYLPTPDEYLQYKFEIEKELERKSKQY